MPIRPIGAIIEDQMFTHQTFLTAEAVAGATTLTVKSIISFAINLVLLIGELGDENSEIIKTHASTAPTGTTITLAAALKNTHGPYTKIRVMLYDQIEISHAATVGGTKSVIDIIDIDPQSVETRFDDATKSSGYFFTRFRSSISIITEAAEDNAGATLKDTGAFTQTEAYYIARVARNATDNTYTTITGKTSNDILTLADDIFDVGDTYELYVASAIFSDYSDPIPYVGFGINTMGFAVNYALKRNKLVGFTKFIDYEFCIDEANACLLFITGKLKGWTKLLTLNSVIGQTARGVNSISLPSDIWENRGNKSILDVKVGTELGLTYKIWPEFEKEMRGVKVTQVRTQATAGQTSLAIDNSYDFDDTGTVNIYVSGTLYSITYTGVTRSETVGVLTGVPASGTGAITVTIPVDTNVWQGESEGKPIYYSIDSDGNLRFWPLGSGVYDNLNVYVDYWTGPTSVDSDADTLDVFRYDAVKHWLTWAIRMQLKNDGKRDFTDGDYIQFSQILSDYIRAEVPAHRKKRGVKVNRITY